MTDPGRRRRLAVATVVLVALIGTLDLVLGFEVSMLVFYCLPVVLGSAALGWRFGVVLAFVSVGLWSVGDVVAGVRYGSWLVLVWNALIALSTYLIIVWLFATVQALQGEMQERVGSAQSRLPPRPVKLFVSSAEV